LIVTADLTDYPSLAYPSYSRGKLGEKLIKADSFIEVGFNNHEKIL
jgi:hypothetical protein